MPLTKNHQNLNLLVTLGIIAGPDLHAWYENISDASLVISKKYYFYEVLIVTTANHDECRKILSQLTDDHLKVRVIRVDQLDKNADFDSLSAVLLKESIGDYVVISSVDELQYSPLIKMFSEFETGCSLIRLRRSKSSFLENISSKIFGLLTGFETDLCYLRTTGVARSILNEIIKKPALARYFRFNSARLEPAHRVLTVQSPATRKGTGALADRISTALQLVSLATPRLLIFLMILTSLLSCAAFFWVVYVMLIWGLKTDVAEGWVSIAFFLGVGLFVLSLILAVVCLALSRLLNLENDPNPLRISGDISKSDLFKGYSLLNVETLTEKPHE